MSAASEQNQAESAGGFHYWSGYSRMGLTAAFFALLIDQIHKYWMIEIYSIAERGRVAVTSFFDLIMIWNPGISYGLLPQESAAGRIGLMAVSLAAISALFLWMSNAGSRLAAVSLGLIIGGAIGNLIDRLIYGAVADFFSFHFAGFYWYVFNLADVAIAAGVVGLILDWILPSHTKVPKRV